MDSVVQLELSNITKAVFIGRKGHAGKPEIIGFKQFASKYLLMVKAAKAGCPFAAGALPSIRKEIVDVTNELIKEIESLESLPMLIPGKIRNVKATTYHLTRVDDDWLKKTLYLFIKYDQYVRLCLLSSAGARISNRECWMRIDAKKTRIRKLFYFCYGYEDYNFRGLDSQGRVEQWNYMVFKFGRPLVFKVNSVV